MTLDEWEQQLSRQLRSELQVTLEQLGSGWHRYFEQGLSPEETIAQLIEGEERQLDLLPKPEALYVPGSLVEWEGRQDRIYACRWWNRAAKWIYRSEKGFGYSPAHWIAEENLRPSSAQTNPQNSEPIPPSHDPEDTGMNEAAVNTIATELRRIADAMTHVQPSLGFGPAPKQVMPVYCDRKNGGLWYTLDALNNPTVIEQEALTGYVHSLEVKASIDQGEKVYTLHCTLEADNFYLLESLSTAHFSKGLLSAIAVLTPEQLQQPIIVVPHVLPESEDVLYCQVYQGGHQVFAPYDQQTDWKQVSKTALNGVKLATSEGVDRAIPS